ncbi:hypothetical protein PCE1_004087 [Barthelona sp. PCE]
MDKIRLSDPKEQNNESYHVRVHLYSNVSLKGGLRSDYHEVGCLEIQNCVLPNSTDFNTSKYALLTHEELLATYNNIKGPRQARISRDMVSKASCHVIGLCIFTGKHYLRRILNDEHIKIIWSAMVNNWIKPEFDKDSPSRSYSNRTESELSPSAQSVHEPPLSAQRVADEFDFNDTGIRERDVRAALVHGHTHESVKGLPGFRAIIRQHSSASASNSGVEREFSMLKRLHSKNQTKLSTRTRFNWFLLNEASAAPMITYDELKEIVKTI